MRSALLLALGCSLPACAGEMVLHLFTDWYGVDPGTAVFKVDRTKVDAENLRILEQVKDYYKIQLTDGDSTAFRVNVPNGVRVRAEVAKMSEPFLKQEKPWESGEVAAEAVLQEGGRYRIWYGCGTPGRDKVVLLPNGRKKLGSEDGYGGLCYAESKDGFHWTKPSLGLVEFKGSKDNNIVTTEPIIGSGAVFIDPSAPPEERYKLVANTDIRQFEPNLKASYTVLGGAVSPDGIHWKKLPEPLWRESFNGDGSPIAHFEPQTGKYVLYTRSNYPRRRSIGRAETADFRHWPHPVIILTPGPDEDPSVDFYDNPHVQYPGAANAHLMLVSTYHRDTSLVDIRLASSMDGDGWNWLSPRTVVELGKKGEWNGGELYAVPHMVQLPDGRVAVAVDGMAEGHEEYWRAKFEGKGKLQRGVGWALWEDGRIAGIEADKTGEFTTLPLKATGQPIQINARTKFSGSVQVDVLLDGQDSKPVLRSRALTGDLKWCPLEWEQGDMSSVTGKTIRLRFSLFGAKVFGFRGEGLEFVSSYKRK